MDLIKWELKQTFRSKIFWTIGILMFLLGNVFHITDYTSGELGGYDLFLGSCNDFNSLATFFIGIFAALHITGAFEDRKISAAVMAGNSRAKVLAANFVSFATSIALFFATSVILPSTVCFAVFGAEIYDGSFIRNVIVRSLIFIFAEISCFSICFLTSLLCKKTGFATVLNLGISLTLSIGVQIVAMKEWGMNIIKFTPVGQSMMVIGDVSNSNLALASAVCTVFLAAAAALSYMRFRREEIK